MDQDDVRTMALALPGAAEAPHHDMTSFRVGGKIFATMPPDGEHLHAMVDEGEVAAAIASDPASCAELRWGQRLAGVRVALPVADPEQVRELLEEAWRRRAPAGLVASFEGPRP